MGTVQGRRIRSRGLAVARPDKGVGPSQVAHERIKCVFFAHPRLRKKRVERGWFIMHEKRL